MKEMGKTTELYKESSTFTASQTMACSCDPARYRSCLSQLYVCVISIVSLRLTQRCLAGCSSNRDQVASRSPANPESQSLVIHLVSGGQPHEEHRRIAWLSQTVPGPVFITNETPTVAPFTPQVCVGPGTAATTEPFPNFPQEIRTYDSSSGIIAFITKASIKLKSANTAGTSSKIYQATAVTS